MRKNLLIALLIIVVISVSFAVFGLFTTKGSKFLATETLQRYIQDSDIQANESDGNLVEGMTFRNLDLDQIKNLPAGSRLKIQKLFINLKSLSLDGLVVEVDNARLMLPDSEPIVIAGTLQNQELNLNIFSRGFTISEALGYFPDLKGLIPLKGEINSVDLFVTGNYQEPKINGDFIIEKFIYKGFILSDSSCKVDIILKDIENDAKLFGSVVIENGILNTQKVSIKLDPGEISFLGPWNQPRVAFKGSSRVEDTKINIDLKGTLEKPELKLTSEPSYSEQKLMVMLATGKSWQSVEDTMVTGVVSPDLTKDFIDYFIFAGRSNRFAQKFGVHDFTIKLDTKTKGVGVKKDLSDKLEVGYGVEQRMISEIESSVNQKVQGEYKVTDRVLVGAEKEVVREKKDDSLNDPASETKSDGEVYLKYKAEF